MSLAIQTQQINVGNSANFTFSGSISPDSCLIGISHFRLSYGDTDHKVQQASIAVTSTFPGNNTVNVQVSGTLTDGSYGIDQSESYAVVVVVAKPGTSSTDLTLQNGDANSSFAVPSGNLTIMQPVLAGFDLAYGDCYNVQQLGVTNLHASLSGTSVTLSANVYMNDDSDHVATTMTFSGGLIASNISSPGFEIQETTNVFNGQTQDIVKSPTWSTWSNYVTMLTGFNVSYNEDSDEWVNKIEVYLTYASNSVQASCWMSDSSGHLEDSSASYVTGIVIGY